jgi:flavin reductase (DIM6/NTAB) family NADH-FMN oxidoreductase RutF
VRSHELPAADLSARDNYRLMTDLVAPRPIAWVSTLDGEGRSNLAPFSYFQAVCSSPPTIVLGLGWQDRRPKHTLANILETGELTISHVSESLAALMNASAANYPDHVSEWDACGVESAPAVAVAPARVAAALGGFECRLTHAIPLGSLGGSSIGSTATPSSTLVIAEVVHVWLAEELLQRNERGHLLPIDPAKLAAVGRLGGDAYTTTAGYFELARPGAPK